MGRKDQFLAQSKECQNICITSSNHRLFCFAQHLFEFTTRYVYGVLISAFLFVACRLVELVEFTTPSCDVTKNIPFRRSIDRSIRIYSTIPLNDFAIYLERNRLFIVSYVTYIARARYHFNFITRTINSTKNYNLSD